MALISDVLARSAIDAVIFDMDGLLFDTERISREASFAAATVMGLAMTDEFYATLIGVPGRDCEVLLRNHYGEGFSMPVFDDAYHVHVERLLDGGVPVKSGAAELLRHLAAQGVPIALATSSGRQTTERNLQRAGWRDLFKAVVTRDEVARGKPFPDLFLRAADQLDVAPQRCLALEDSHNGIRAAQAAGCVPVMVPDLLAPTDEIRALCRHVARDLHEIRTLFVVP
jgi:HAD superfamily hydrolase (TIGR01509 family)